VVISRRTNRVVAAPAAAGTECAGCADLRAAFARLAEKVRRIEREIVEQDLKADGNPRPHGNWVTVAKAAAESGFKETGIWAKARRGEVRRWKLGGRVLVDLDGIPHKKTTPVFSAAVAEGSKKEEESHR
jgi:hypothetical protein